MDFYRISDFRLCKLIIRKSFNISYVKEEKKRWKSFGFIVHSSCRCQNLSVILLTYFPSENHHFLFALGLSVQMSVTTKESQINWPQSQKKAINTHKHCRPNNSYWPNKVNLKYCMCSTSVTTRVTNTNRWRMSCTRLWLQHIKLVVSVQCDDQHASGWVGGWKQNLCREYWHDHHLACLKEVISVLMLSICASESSREGLTGLFMWLNSCSACYIANGGVEEGSWVGE